MPPFFVMSLPEASYLYMGLALQAMVRMSGIRHWVQYMVGIWAMVLLFRALRHPSALAGFLPLLGYLSTCMICVILFWPEITPFGWLERSLAPSGVVSYAASQDPDAQILSAEDTGMIPDTLRAPALLSPGFRILLPALTEWPLAMARAINSQAHRTFSAFLPMQWYLGMDLTAGGTTAIQDWTHNCYIPVLTQVHGGQSIQTADDTLPWGNTAIARALSARTVTPSSQTGITTQVVPGRTELPCDAYLDAVLNDTQAWLLQQKSPAGTPLLQVFQEDLGMEPLAQARHFVYREILRAAGTDVPAPSLTGVYAGLRAGAIAGNAVSVGSFTAVVGWLSGTFTMGKALFGAARGAAQGTFSEWQRVMDGLSWIVGIAVFLTWWAPYILGIASLVLVGLFPLFFFLWALLPGAQFQALHSYFITLFFVFFAPLWWALVDLSQRLAASLAPQSSDVILGMGNTAMGFIWASMITVLGLLVIMVVTAALLFGTLRSIGGVLRTAV